MSTCLPSASRLRDRTVTQPVPIRQSHDNFRQARKLGVVGRGVAMAPGVSDLSEISRRSSGPIILICRVIGPSHRSIPAGTSVNPAWEALSEGPCFAFPTLRASSDLAANSVNQSRSTHQSDQVRLTLPCVQMG